MQDFVAKLPHEHTLTFSHCRWITLGTMKRGAALRTPVFSLGNGVFFYPELQVDSPECFLYVVTFPDLSACFTKMLSCFSRRQGKLESAVFGSRLCSEVKWD